MGKLVRWRLWWYYPCFTSEGMKGMGFVSVYSISSRRAGIQIQVLLRPESVLLNFSIKA